MKAPSSSRPGVCPRCGGVTEQILAVHGGCVSELVLTALRGQPNGRRVRPASFWACVACEWCAAAGEGC